MTLWSHIRQRIQKRASTLGRHLIAKRRTEWYTIPEKCQIYTRNSPCSRDNEYYRKIFDRSASYLSLMRIIVLLFLLATRVSLAATSILE